MVSVMVYPCMFCVAFSMDLFVLCVACDGSYCVWLDVLYWIDHVWSSIECVCCACDPSEHLE